MVVLGVLQVRHLSVPVEQVFFIAQNPALLASPPISLEHRLPGAGRIKRYSKHLAPLPQRRGQCRRCSCLTNTAASPFAGAMFSPPVVPVALWAAILSLVLPRIVSAVLHSELTAAIGILTHKWRRVGALPTAMPAAFSGQAMSRLECLAALLVFASQQYSLSLGQVHAIR